MKRSREELERELNREFNLLLSKKNEIRSIANQAKYRWNVPFTETTDYLTKRKSLSDANDFILYVFCDIILDNSLDYFTSGEKYHFDTTMWEDAVLKFPLEFDMVEISNEQYIGRISVQKLMQLKDAQLINYNENAQRTMKHIVKGNVEFYEISLNKNAVKAIMDSYTTDLYIPNTITLNLPEDAKYRYYKEEHKLVIDKVAFDILDGYHRYIAMSKICSEIPEFDYDMELRIVKFNEIKAKRFIWQEDQKTKMKKIDSESMNTSKISNMIIERINNNPECTLAGRISRNKGQINAAIFADIIDNVLLKGTKKSEERLLLKQYSIELVNSIETVLDIDPKLLNDTWNKKQLYLMVYLLKYGDISKEFKTGYKKISQDDSIYAGSTVKQADITRTHKLLRKEGY